MKRRIIKKNINRFITPYIKDLPKTIYSVQEFQESDKTIIINQQHIIVNGKKKGEGEMIFRCSNLLLNIKRTGKLIKDIVENHKHVYLRIPPEMRGNRLYIRIVTE